MELFEKLINFKNLACYDAQVKEYINQTTPVIQYADKSDIDYLFSPRGDLKFYANWDGTSCDPNDYGNIQLEGYYSINNPIDSIEDFNPNFILSEIGTQIQKDDHDEDVHGDYEHDGYYWYYTLKKLTSTDVVYIAIEGNLWYGSVTPLEVNNCNVESYTTINHSEDEECGWYVFKITNINSETNARIIFDWYTD